MKENVYLLRITILVQTLAKMGFNDIFSFVINKICFEREASFN